MLRRQLHARAPALLVGFLAVALSACTTIPFPPPKDQPSSVSWIPRPERLHAVLDAANGGRIVDASGREVLLRGVNVNALAEYWQYGKFATTFPLTAADARRIAGTGWNAVRLLVSWSRVEPEPGKYDDRYLAHVRDAVHLLASQGVYSIIDFHQDAWGPTLAAPPGTVCPTGLDPAFGWDGAPGWATLDAGASRCVPAGIRELSPAVRASFTAFWTDAPGPGGVGVRTRYASMLGYVAEQFAREDAVAGYDLMNEPNAFTGTELQGLSDLYAAAIASMRAGEARAHGFAHLVFFEPGALWSDAASGVPPPFAHDGGVVFAPHIYRGGLTAGPVERSEFERARRDAATFGGAPVLVGEWGSGPERAEDPTDVYFRRHQQFQDEFHFSATLWTWRESCGDPHKAGDARAGRIPSVWGEWEVDCRTNTVTGPRQALVDQLSRAFVRAAPGRLATTAYAAATGAFTAAGHDAPAHTDVIAWYPTQLHDPATITSLGLNHVRLRAAPGGGVYLVGKTTGGSWLLTVAKGSR